MSDDEQQSPSFSALRNAAQQALRDKQPDEATRLSTELQQRFPERPAGMVLKAQIARARADWATALECYDVCITEFGTDRQSDWSYGKALCLQRLGRPAEAEAVLRDLIEQPGEHDRAAALLAQFSTQRDGSADRAGAANRPPKPVDPAVLELLELSRTDPTTALQSFRAGPLGASDRYEARQAGAWLAVNGNDMPLLRELLPSLIAQAATLEQCVKLMPTIALAFEGWERTAAWLGLEQQLIALAPSAAPAQRHAGAVVAMRLKLALGDHNGFLLLHAAQERTADALADLVWMPKFDRLAQVLRRRPFPDHDADKVFGIGLSRTGTTSLAAALDRLGLFTAHYRNDFSFDLLAIEDAFLFDALTDIPFCLYFEAMAQMFPRSRFIYTTRQMEPWIESFCSHSRLYNGTDDFAELRRRATTPGTIRHGARSAQLHVALFYRYDSPQAAREAFEARMFAFFSGERADQLLVLDVSDADAWPTLCRFLERPVQEGPFPHRNTKVAPSGH